MNFVVVGLSQKTAPMEIREQAYVPESSVAECLRHLVDRDLVEGGVLLSTCNRTELYAAAAGHAADDRLLEAFGEWPHQLDFESWRRHAYRLAGGSAVEHLFRVACGLDSMVDLLLFGTSFTTQPRATTIADSNDTVVQSRRDDLLQGLRKPGMDLWFARSGPHQHRTVLRRDEVQRR